MIDSCNPRNVEPGLAATYSKPSDLITSIMKSDPGRSVVYVAMRGGGGLVSAAASVPEGSGVAGGVGVCDCAIDTEGWATNAAAPAAAPLRKSRRSTEPFLAIRHSPRFSLTVLNNWSDYSTSFQGLRADISRLALQGFR